MIMYATHGPLTIIVTGYRAILRVENSKRSRYKLNLYYLQTYMKYLSVLVSLGGRGSVDNDVLFTSETISTLSRVKFKILCRNTSKKNVNF